MVKKNQVFTLCNAEVNLSTQTIRHHDGRFEHVQLKFLEVLYCLAQSYPDVVSRDKIIQEVWQGNRYVGEKALTNAIWHIRKSLHLEHSDCIQTVRKKGYRLTQKPVVKEEQLLAPDNKEKSSGSINYVGLVLLLLSVFALAIYFFTEHTGSSQSVITPITTSSGREAYPDISSDGKKMLYYWKRNNENQDLFYRDIERIDLPPVQLTHDAERESKSVWNVTMDKVFYIQKTWDYRSCRVVSLDLRTREKKFVGQCHPDVNPSIAISNDGTTLAYVGNDDHVSSVGVYTLDLQDPYAQPKRFSCASNCEFSDRDIEFSPDDRYFLMTRRTQLDEEDLFLVERESEESKRLTIGLQNVQGVAWHPNKNLIVYSAERAENRGAYALNLDNNEVLDLGIEGFSFPKFISGSNDIIYHDRRLRKFISTLEIEKQSAAIPFPLINSDYVHTNAMYSRATEKIVYISNESGDKELWTASLNGTQSRQLTRLAGNISFPSWSPDGTSVAFLLRHQASDETSIQIVDIETQEIKELTPNGLNEFLMPTWSKDGSSINVSAALERNDENFNRAYFKINIKDSTYRLISERSGGYIIESNTSDTIWYSDGNDAIYTASLSDPVGTEVRLIEPGLMSSAYSWFKSADGIYFLQRYADHERINFYAFDTSLIETIIKAPLRTFSNRVPFSFIDKSNSLVITQSVLPKIDIKRLSHPVLND